MVLATPFRRSDLKLDFGAYPQRPGQAMLRLKIHATQVRAESLTA